jgi:hypothetical protein
MGWTISHGSNKYGEESCSYGWVGTIADYAERVLAAEEWTELAVVFRRPSGDPFTVSPQQAARCAELLDKAAAKWRVPRAVAKDTRLFAAAARRASDAGQRWRWR